MNISFLYNRLRRMSFRELIYRLCTEVCSIWDQLTYNRKVFHIGPEGSEGVLLPKPFLIAFPEELIKKADKICNGSIDIFAAENVNIKEGIDYHKDYKSGLVTPSNIYGKNIDYRDSTNYGDIKYIWEINRHLETTQLALAYHMTGEAKYLKKLEDFFRSWIEQNPFMLGVNWCSSLENAIRLINWAISWQLVKKDLDKSVSAKLMDSVFRHCWFISRNHSRFSSSNNHLIGEAAGLYIASVLFPQTNKSVLWRKNAKKILEEECIRQHHPDGVNKEQAICYQQFVFDFLFLSFTVGRNNGDGFSHRYLSVLEKSAEYIASICDINYNIPKFGDDDNGLAIDIGQREYGIYKSILNLSAFVFGRKEFLCKDYEKDCKTALCTALYGIDITNGVSLLKNSLPVKFASGGYYIINRDKGTSKEQKLIFDCGELGYLSLAAHGHADALSFHFSAGGIPIFIDPGTYAYHTNRKWRNYFRGTSAHNTISIDSKNQSEIAGNFMWGRKANAALLSFEEGISVKGAHDGYRYMSNNVDHIREIRYYVGKNMWVITDELITNGKHNIELTFQVNPECKIEKVGSSFRISFAEGHVIMNTEDFLLSEIVEGCKEPLQGWFSPSYDVKLRGKTILCRCIVTGNKIIKTSFNVEFI